MSSHKIFLQTTATCIVHAEKEANNKPLLLMTYEILQYSENSAKLTGGLYR